jgi:hypothetical protein
LNGPAIRCLLDAAERLHEPSARVVFELGAALKMPIDMFPMHYSGEELWASRYIDRYEKWCEEARSAIWCWLVVGKRWGVAKDIRLLIATLLWEERAEWSKSRC